jgi:class 3 adenylate cyclase
VSVAYQVLGEGRFDLVFVPGAVSHLELAWQVPGIAAFNRRLASFCRLILFDKRGTGMSDRVSGSPTLETRMDDVRAVMDAVGSQRAALLGVSEGGSMSALFAATYPERVWALILCSAYARERWAPDYPWGIGDADYDREAAEEERDWGTQAHALMIAQALAPSADEENHIALATLIRQAASPGAAAALTRMNRDIDVRDVLPSIHVPTLVLNRAEEDSFYVQASRHLASHIPGALHVEVPGIDHASFAGATAPLLDEVERFLTDAWQERGAEEATGPERILTTILFTDIVGSTAIASKIGDAGWRELLNQHHTIVRRLLARFRGVEVDTAGDGFFASFDGPARAVRCACAISDAVHDLGLEVRAGLHTGECERLDGKMAGIAVHIGARVAAQADSGEVLVSGTVRDLVVGSGLQFNEHGAAELKGVPGQWRLYAVERK